MLKKIAGGRFAGMAASFALRCFFPTLLVLLCFLGVGEAFIGDASTGHWEYGKYFENFGACISLIDDSHVTCQESLERGDAFPSEFVYVHTGECDASPYHDDGPYFDGVRWRKCLWQEDCTDFDRDGYAVQGGDCGPVDCDDSDPAVHPGAGGICDGESMTFPGATDAGYWKHNDYHEEIKDRGCHSHVEDPHVTCQESFERGDAVVVETIYIYTGKCDAQPFMDQKPYFDEVRHWGCDWVGCTDDDQDGYKIEGGDCGPVDCNDGAPTAYPGHEEVCGDNIDNDCDGKVDEGCCSLEVGSVQGSGSELNAATGGLLKFTSSISDDSDKAVKWSLTITRDENGSPVSVFSAGGNGKTVAVPWDGKDRDGKVTVGTYTVKVTAQEVDNPTCSDSAELTFRLEKMDDCRLKFTVGSSANVASGELTDSLDLFSASGGSPALDFGLHYASQDDYSGSLGIGWHHSYDITLSENEFGEVVLKTGSGQWRLYTPEGSGYTSPPGDYSTLVKNADGIFVLTRKDGTRYHFTALGKVTSITDRNGNALTFTYAGGLLAAVIDEAGRRIELSYDGAGKLAKVTDPAGWVYSFTVGKSLESVTFPDGATWSYSYDENAFLTARTDPEGHLTTYAYDGQHRVTRSVDPEGRTRSIAYPPSDEAVRTTAVTEKDGGAWLYTYDTKAGDLLARTDPEGNVTSYTYDSNHNQLTKTDAAGTTAYTYDGAGNMTSVTDPLGQTTSYAYNEFGQVTSITDPEGSVTRYEYDSKGNLIRTTDPTGAATSYVYDAKGNVASVTDAAGAIMRMSYDEAGNVTSVTDAAGSTTRFVYDAAGRLIKQTDAKGSVTTFEYDARGNLLKIVDPAGGVTTYTYDAKGNKTSETDGNGRITRYEYNAQGQVTKTMDALGNVTAFAYGGSGCASCGGGVDKLASLTDAKGQTTSFEYDTLGRLIREIDPLGSVTTYVYDAKGNLVAKTDANGGTIRYSYDALSRLLKKSYPDGTEETFTYDAKGNLLTATSRYISYFFVYDAAGRVISVTDNFGRVVSYEYDAAGRRSKLVAPDGKTLRYEYNAVGRLVAILNGGNYTFSYDALGRRSTMTLPNGVVVSYGYDNAGRLITLVHRNAAGAVIASNSYTHDKVGNRLTNANQDRMFSYTYDAIYRLTEALSSAPGYSSNAKGKGGGISNATQQQKEFYVYDPVGNRLRTDKVASYEHDAGNEMLQAGGTSFRYDRNGNLIEKVSAEGVTTYAWDYESRLTKVTTSAGTVVEFKYDPFGRRIEKKVTAAEGVKVTRFIYDNEDILFETDEIGAIGNRYIHGPGIDEPLALIQGKEIYYYHADGLGSIVALTDKTGKVVQAYEYDSYGNLHDQKNRIKQPYIYTGREHDRETGLYYYRARYYNAETGRFISKDPIGFYGGEMNLFEYVSSNPIGRTDPSGLYDIVFYGSPYKSTSSDIYESYVVITENNFGDVVAGPFWASILPDQSRDNCQGGCTNVAPGVYDYSYKIFSNNNPRYSAIWLGTVPSVDNNKNNNNKMEMTGIWIHSGYLSETGSEGCLTIHPDLFPVFMAYLEKEKDCPGKVRIYK